MFNHYVSDLWFGGYLQQLVPAAKYCNYTILLHSALKPAHPYVTAIKMNGHAN